MESKQKLFAFKLAQNEEAKTGQIEGNDSNETKWKGRDGAAVAGCTEYKFPGNYRYSSDAGAYC